MATNPPFEMEDQTDEDFFDKLVDDDDDFGTPPPVPQSNFDVSKGFSGLSIKDAGEGGVSEASGESGSLDLNGRSVDAAFADQKNVLPSSSSFDFDSAVDNEVNAITSTDNLKEEDFTVAKAGDHLADAVSGFPPVVADADNSLVSSSSFEFAALTSSNDKMLESEATTDMIKTNFVSSGGGIQEVGWSSFHADSLTAVGTEGFGSYSDFFTDLGGNDVNFLANMETEVNNGSEMLSGAADYSFGGSANHVDSALFQQGQGQEMGAINEQSSVTQGIDDSQNWENLYPGWKYDYNTGQWYQVDGYAASQNPQGNFDNVAVAEAVSGVNENSDVSYLQQTAQSVAGAVSETGTTESISNWNQVSETNNGYPEHMVFDPQYPGWYYDMLVQEWRSLDSYTSLQSTSQSLDQQNQTGALSHNDSTMYNNYEAVNNYAPQGAVDQNQDTSWASSYNEYSTPNTNNLWQPETTVRSDRQFDASFSQGVAISANLERQNSINSFAPATSYNQASQSYVHSNGTSGLGFVPVRPSHQANMATKEQVHFSNDAYGIQKTTSFPQQSFPAVNELSHPQSFGRSPDGRPAHALVTFGFGGKLIVMKNTRSVTNVSFGNQDPVADSISVHNMMEVVQKTVDPNTGASTSDYFRALCLQSLPGPLVGGSVGSKDLNKWIDERIGSCDSSVMDHRRAEALRLLLSLLKIACQHYGKLRSPFGTDVALKDGDSPEVAVAKLFASAKISKNMQFGDYGGQRQCLQLLPPAGQIQEAAYEVQNLLVSGRKHEALQRAQEGQLWGPALVLAWQLGNQFYEETVKQMALHQLVPGSPLRTLCLLAAGQPAEVFSSNSPAVNNVHHSSSMSQDSAQVYASSGIPYGNIFGLNARFITLPPLIHQLGANAMLEDWEENLAIIAANRTKDDELVITHLGDCLWKDRSENIAAHLCYLVAEANFESYSDSARLCLIGADHWKSPRTYASPAAIQRTELYEYAKVLGNSQFILLPFQPYKLLYAHMLAEVGKISDSLKYCQVLLKSLKTGRAPEVEMWRQVVVSLEDRIRTHQQGGYSANLAPAKLVGKLLNFFDSTAHKVVGTLPPAPTPLQTGFQGNDYNSGQVNKVPNSQSTTSVSSLTPSASMEPISDWTADNSRMTVHNRSVSEPDFGRSPRQVGSSGEATTDSAAQGKASAAGGGATSRFSRFSFGTQLLQKTVGLVLRPRSDKQAKLGETNKFYFDEKLKRWVEEGAEPPAEQAAPPPPPTMAAFQNGTSDYNLKSALKSEGFSTDRSPDPKGPPSLSDHSSGIPPMPPSTNQFSARARTGVRSRYVDTFNKGSGAQASFQSPSIAAVKPPTPAANPKFFIPAPVAASTADQTMEPIAESEDPSSAPPNGTSPTSSSSSATLHQSAPSPSPSESSPTSSIQFQRFPSMDNIQRRGSMVNVKNTSSFQASNSRRTASWSGSVNDGRPAPQFMTPQSESSFSRMAPSGGSFDELQEVEL